MKKININISLNKKLQFVVKTNSKRKDIKNLCLAYGHILNGASKRIGKMIEAEAFKPAVQKIYWLE